MRSVVKTTLVAATFVILGAGVQTCRSTKHAKASTSVISDESLVRKLAKLTKEKAKNISTVRNGTMYGITWLKQNGDAKIAVVYFDFPPMGVIDTNDKIRIVVQAQDHSFLDHYYSYSDKNLDGIVDSASIPSIRQLSKSLLGYKFDNRKVDPKAQKEYMHYVRALIKELSK